MSRTEPSKEIDAFATAVIGAAIEVHRVLGPGLLESVYEHALAIELELKAIPFERQRPVNINYKLLQNLALLAPWRLTPTSV